ncbi:cystatin-A-like [Mugil cephalus]|uniref:cystatin-A-like n=1 Tax=Mugil cephalus TaxID=48193 RepID=UPI001FB5B4E2|nr:cystatin-A-like [Mugil cephalus]
MKVEQHNDVAPPVMSWIHTPSFIRRTNVTCGGFTEPRPATEEIQKICDEVKGHVEERTNKKYEIFTALEYRSQVVAGTNYLIKVNSGPTSHLHVIVFEALPGDGGQKSVSGLEEGHTKDDPLVPF